MDSSHVSLCAVMMRSEGFDHYRCDKNTSLGLNTPNLAKILKCAGNEDLVTLKSEEDTDTLTMMFESANQVPPFFPAFPSHGSPALTPFPRSSLCLLFPPRIVCPSSS